MSESVVSNGRRQPRNLRVYEISRKAGLGTGEVMQRLSRLGIKVTSHLSSVPMGDVERLARSLNGKEASHREAGKLTARPPSLSRKILAESARFWPQLAGILLLDLAATPLLLLTPIPLKIAVDSVLGAAPLPGFIDVALPGGVTRSKFALLAAAAILMVLVALMTQLHSLCSYLFKTRTGEKMTLSFRGKLFGHVQRLSLQFHDTRGTADSVYRIEYDAPAIQWLTIYGGIPLVAAIVAFVTTLYVMARLDWQLALVALGVSPFLAYYSRAFNRRMRPRYLDVKGIESGALKVVHETLAAIRVVKVFGREEDERQRFLRTSGEGMQARTRLALSESLFSLVVNVTIAIGTAAVLYIGVRNVASGALTIGELLMIIAYLAQLYTPLRVISSQVTGLQRSMAGARRAFNLLEESPEVIERPNARPLTRALGAIELRNVSFSYEPASPVLRRVNVTIPAGARFGIAGRTGAGKTTLLSLLLRLYDPTNGEILLDGVDLRDYKLADLRNQFAFVLQEPVLFSTSIAENIAYARPEARSDDIVRAAKAAGAHSFIARLPDGYDTIVGERGMRLSGGERQRITLARAFLKDAPILILDEPTSAVDTRTEAGIMAAMRRLMAGRTCLLITHRLGTLETCDHLMQLERGRILVTSEV